MPDPEVVEGIVKGLSEPMRVTLWRLADNMVWTDGRSRRALEKRGLASVKGTMTDAMLGTFTVTFITPLGLAVAQHLRNRILSEQE